MIRFLVVFLLILSFRSVLAQNKEIDSLRTVLSNHPQADTFRVNRLIELAEQCQLVDRNKTDSLCHQAIETAKTIKYSYGQAKALEVLALGTGRQGQLNKGCMLLQQALPLAIKSGHKDLVIRILQWSAEACGQKPKQRDAYLLRAFKLAQSTGDEGLILRTHYMTAQLYYELRNYPAAIQWALQLLHQVEKKPNQEYELMVLSVLAFVYIDLNDYDQALRYLKRKLILAQKQGDKFEQGVAWCQLGDAYLKRGQIDHATENYQHALAYQSSLDQTWLLEIEANLAQCYDRKGLYKPAFKYAYRALAKMPDSFNFYNVEVFLPLSQLHLHTGQLDSALFYGQQSYQLAHQLKEYLMLRNACEVLTEVYAQWKDFAKAYHYQRQFIVYKDSLNNEDVTRRATAAQFDQQMNQQRSQIMLLQKNKQLQTEESRRQRLLLYTSLVVLTLIGGLLALVYRNNRQKQKANALLAQQRDQINQTLTELKATQNQLIQKEKMASLGELTAGIAHEIQNPLNFVNNFSEVSTEIVEELAEESQKPQRDSSLENDLLTDLRANLQKINHHGQRASNIVKGMLEHSRSSTGDVQPTNLNGLADEYLRLAYHGQRRSGDSAKNKDFNCELVTDLDSSIGQVAVMSQEIGRVLLNLFSNAFYAVHQRQKQGEPGYQPAVRIRTRRLAKGVEIRISDNGVGMAKEVQQKIFQPFFTTKPTGEGTGLGLSLSYDIITKGHGGTLAVESQEGEGTEFIITIPV